MSLDSTGSRRLSPSPCHRHIRSPSTALAPYLKLNTNCVDLASISTVYSWVERVCIVWDRTWSSSVQAESSAEGIYSMNLSPVQKWKCGHSGVCWWVARCKFSDILEGIYSLLLSPIQKWTCEYSRMCWWVARCKFSDIPEGIHTLSLSPVQKWTFWDMLMGSSMQVQWYSRRNIHSVLVFHSEVGVWIFWDVLMGSSVQVEWCVEESYCFCLCLQFKVQARIFWDVRMCKLGHCPCLQRRIFGVQDSHKEHRAVCSNVFSLLGTLTERFCHSQWMVLGECHQILLHVRFVSWYGA
jgi:hypothetical protein